MREKSILDLKRKIINRILKKIAATETNTNFDFEKDVSFMTHPRVVGKLVLKITLLLHNAHKSLKYEKVHNWLLSNCHSQKSWHSY